MTTKKIIKALVSSIKGDLDPALYGAFGDNPDYVSGRVDDLIVIAKTIGDDTLLEQAKKASHDLLNGDSDMAAKDLDGVASKAE